MRHFPLKSENINWWNWYVTVVIDDGRNRGADIRGIIKTDLYL